MPQSWKGSTLEDLLELNDQDFGTDDGTSQGESGSVASPSERQPAKVNLDDDENFRKWKSAADKRDAQAQQTIRNLQQQTDAYNARLRAIEMEGLDDVGKVAYENRLLKQAIADRDAEENRRYAEYVWSNLIDEVHREHGIPKEELEDAKDSNDLWRMGRKYERENGKVLSDGSRTNNKVALGGGASSSSAESSIRQEYRTAKSNNDWHGMNNAKDKAIAKGIDPESLRR
jgi:hypothetical protein